MRSWIGKGIILALIIATVPMARGMQRFLSFLNDGDGEITSFAINHMVAALPTLVAFCVAGLLIWWLRALFAKEKLLLAICYGIAIFGGLNFFAEVMLESAEVPESDDSRNRVAHPYIEFKGASGSGGHNQLGYGGDAPLVEKAEGEYRIFVLGGSTVRFGNPTVSQLLEKMFRDEGFEEVRVFNIGVSGSNTGMELARLVFDVQAYKPDLVVSYSGGNDINLPIWMDPRPGYPYNFMVYENHPLYSAEYPTIALAAYGSHLFRLFGNRYFQETFSERDELRRSAGWNSTEWRDGIAEAYTRNIEMSAKVARALDSDFVAFLQPMLFSKKNRSAEEQAYLEGIARRTGLSGEDLVTYFNDVRTGINDRIGAMNQPSSFRYVDLSTAYDAMPKTVFPDFIHTGPDARQHVTRMMFETLRDVRAGAL